MSLSLISSSIDVYITISNFALFGLNKPPNRWKHINSHISKLWFCSYCFFEKLSRANKEERANTSQMQTEQWYSILKWPLIQNPVTIFNAIMILFADVPWQMWGASALRPVPPVRVRPLHGGVWRVRSSPLQLQVCLPGLTTNSILFCWLSQKSRIVGKKCVFNKRITIKVCVRCCWQCLGRHTRQCPCIFVGLEAAHEMSQGPLKGAMSAQKALQWSKKTGTRDTALRIAVSHV